MAKKVIANIKLQIKAGKATPSPPIGPALGQHGVNIMEFCKAYNAMTQNQEGMVIPVVITVYADRSFTFVTKTPPASVLLKQAAKIAKGAGDPKRDKVGTVTVKQVKEIAELKSHPKGQLPVSVAPESGTVAPQVGAAPQAARAGQPPWPPQPTPEIAANEVTAGRVTALTSEVAELRAEVDRLRQKVTKLEARLTALGG